MRGMTSTQIEHIDALRVVSEPTAAGILGISPDTLRRLSQRGQGPRRIKISERRIGYRLADVLAWLKQREAGDTAA